MPICNGCQSRQEQGYQQPGPADSSAGEDGVEQAVENDAGVEHCQHETVGAHDGVREEGKIQAHQPDRQSGLVEHFFAVDQHDEHIQQGGCHRQNDLTPHFKCIPGPFQTGEHNAGHCRADQAKCHQPRQHVFTADE